MHQFLLKKGGFDTGKMISRPGICINLWKHCGK